MTPLPSPAPRPRARERLRADALPAAPVRERRRAGFTLIEVMVATSILLVIVLMIGGIFRQASSFWDTGYARAEGGMVVRSVVGALGRDLATAVDGRRFDSKWDSPVDGLTPGASSSSFSFYCYKPVTGKGSEYRREIHKITYSASGGKVSRADKVLSDNGGLTDNGSSTLADVNNATFSFYAAKAASSAERDYEDSAPSFDEVSWTVPSIKIRLTLENENDFSGLEVRSLGRDGVPNEESPKKADDIVVK